MPEEDSVKSFQYNAFANDLAQQASQVIPDDIQGEDREFITSIILRFCKMAGDALVKEEDSKLSAMDASLVTQFIGEWIFHKSIDIIRAGIEPDLREGILQKIAFTVFDIAKKAVVAGMPQEQLINLVEAHVKKCFEKALADLQAKGVFSEDTMKNALSQSNIDSMAESQVEEERQKLADEDQDVTDEIACMSDSKIIKLASLAVLLRSFPSDRIKSILSKFNRTEKEVLLSYLSLPDLEAKLDMNTTIRCLEEIKNTFPSSVVISYDRAYRKMYRIVKNSNKEKILDIIKEERPAIQEYVLSCYENRQKKIPAHIADTVSKYLEERAS